MDGRRLSWSGVWLVRGFPGYKVDSQQILRCSEVVLLGKKDLHY